jgi:hypothetical protein
MDNVAIKIRTGLPKIMTVIAFIAITAKGQPEKIKIAKSKLTWYEEWVCFFEILFGKVGSRWIDMAHLYKLSKQTIHQIFDAKLELVHCAYL